MYDGVYKIVRNNQKGQTMARKQTEKFEWSSEPAERFAQLNAAKDHLDTLIGTALQEAADKGYGRTALAKAAGVPSSTMYHALRRHNVTLQVTKKVSTKPKAVVKKIVKKAATKTEPAKAVPTKKQAPKRVTKPVEKRVTKPVIRRTTKSVA